MQTPATIALARLVRRNINDNPYLASARMQYGSLRNRCGPRSLQAERIKRIEDDGVLFSLIINNLIFTIGSS